jgi:hypothetical protein
MGRIGNETPLRLKVIVQSEHQLVDRHYQRLHFSRRAIFGYWR